MSSTWVQSLTRLRPQHLSEDVTNTAPPPRSPPPRRHRNTVTCAITAQSCSGAFAIDSGSGAVTVADTSAIDYEGEQHMHDYRQGDQRRRSASDVMFTVTLTNVNDQTPAYASADTTRPSPRAPQP